MTYFLQVNLCWLLFYGLYFALLSRETFFKLNRIYLIISLLCGLVIPLSISKMEVAKAMPMVEIVQPMVVSYVEFQQNIESKMVQNEATTWGIWTVLMGIYGLGMGIVFLKFGVGLVKIFRLYFNGKKEPKKGFTLVNTEGVASPFSFFKWVFINPKTTQNVDFQQIMEHEKAHVTQKHSFDIVGLEILRGLFWVSPMVHLYARSLRNVHEYLADAAVLQNAEKKQYGRLLISQTAAGSGLAIANHFNFSQLKKRITMMTRNESQKRMLLKYLLSAPLFLLLVLLLTVPKSPLMANTEGVADKIKKSVEHIENQLVTNSKRPEVFVKGSEEGWVLPQNIAKITALEITEGYEIIGFKMLVQAGDGQIPTEIFKNKSGIFNEEILQRISKSQSNDYFHFVEIFIKDLKRNMEYNYGDAYLHVRNEIPKKHIDFILKGRKIRDSIDALPVKLTSPDKRIVQNENGKIDTVEMPVELSNIRLKMLDFVKRNTNVPKRIFDEKINGCIFVFFDLDEKGVISKVRTEPVFTNQKKDFVKGDFSDCEKEAIRILNIFPKELLLEKLQHSKALGSKNQEFIPVNFPTKKVE